jgi:chromosome segregation ATPase
MTSEPIPLPLANARIDELARELTHTRDATEALRAEMLHVEEQLQTLDGRTQRHDAAQEQTREVRADIASLGERVASEITLRRDLGGIVERADSRDRELESELRRVLEVIANRLDRFEEHQAAIDERQRAVAATVAASSGQDQRIEDRFVALERQIAAQRDAAVEHADAVGAVAARIPDLDRRVDELDTESAAARAARQRMEAEIAVLRSVRDREAEVLDLLDQQRATRTRHESRLSEIEEFVTEVQQSLTETADDYSRLSHEQAGAAERVARLGERLEGLRVSIIEHQRRQVRAEEQSGRRNVEETERELRVARTLLTRMSEQTEDAVHELPL